MEPDNILKMINKDWSTKSLMGISKDKLTGAAESSGISSTNFLQNMQTYLMILALFLVILIILAILSCFKSKI
jgi:hypothetical protein